MMKIKRKLHSIANKQNILIFNLNRFHKNKTINKTITEHFKKSTKTTWILKSELFKNGDKQKSTISRTLL